MGKAKKIIKEIIKRIGNIHGAITAMIVDLSISDKQNVVNYLNNIIQSIETANFLRLESLLKNLLTNIQTLKQESEQKQLYENTEGLLENLLEIIIQEKETSLVSTASDKDKIMDEDAELKLYLSNLKRLSSKLNE